MWISRLLLHGAILETCGGRSYYTNSNLASLGVIISYKAGDTWTLGLLKAQRSCSGFLSYSVVSPRTTRTQKNIFIIKYNYHIMNNKQLSAQFTIMYVFFLMHMYAYRLTCTTECGRYLYTWIQTSVCLLLHR